MSPVDPSETRPASKSALEARRRGPRLASQGVPTAEADFGAAARRWRSATDAVVLGLLHDTETSPWLIFAKAARRAADTSDAAVWLPGHGMDGTTRLLAFDGHAPQASVVSQMSKPALWRRVLRKEGEAVLLRVSEAATLLVAPLIAAEQMIGLLTLPTRPANKLLRLEEQRLVTQFCGETSLACQVAQAHGEALQQAVHADRARIASQVNDRIIQALMGAGLILATVDGMGDDLPPTARQRVQDVMESLDQAIRELRTALFSNRVSLPDVAVTPNEPKGIQEL